MIKQGGLLPVNVVAEQLGCSERHVRNLIHQGDLQAVKIGKKRGQRILRESVGKFLDKKRIEEDD
jgi:excisionase family DNA binding protein